MCTVLVYRYKATDINQGGTVLALDMATRARIVHKKWVLLEHTAKEVYESELDEKGHHRDQSIERTRNNCNNAFPHLCPHHADPVMKKVHARIKPPGGNVPYPKPGDWIKAEELCKKCDSFEPINS